MSVWSGGRMLSRSASARRWIVSASSSRSWCQRTLPRVLRLIREVGVVAEPLFADLDRSAGRFFGLVVAALGSRRVAWWKRLPARASSSSSANFERMVTAGRAGARRGHSRRGREHPAHGLHEGRLGLRLVVELLDPARPRVENLAGGEVSPWATVGSERSKRPIRNPRPRRAVAASRLARSASRRILLRLHRHRAGEQTDQHDQRHRRAADQGPVAAGELPHLVEGAGRPRHDRLRVEVAFDVLGHRRRRGVAAVGLLLEGLADDGLEIGVELARCRARSCGAVAAALRRSPEPPRRWRPAEVVGRLPVSIS